MTTGKITWDSVGEKLYETGVDHVVFYPIVENVYTGGVAWNGVTAINEQPSGGEAEPKFADNIQYLNMVSAEKFAASIEAYTYPDEFAQCDGSAEPTPGVRLGQQARKAFGLSYRTLVGNDVDGQDYGYKIHLIYNALAAPSERGHQTVNDSPEAITMSWDLSTTPVPTTHGKPVAHIEIDSKKVSPEKLTLLETMLYGDEGTAPKMPTPDELVTMMTPA